MKNKRNLAAGVLATSVIVAITAYAATSSGGGNTVKRAVGGAASVGTQAAAATTGRKALLPVVPAQTGFDRFIVKYKDGTAARKSTTTLIGSVNAASVRAGVVTASASRGVSAPVSFQHLRALGTGAALVRAARRLTQAESTAFLAQLRSDPNVKYAQADSFKHRLDLIPNDPKFSTLQWDYTDATGGIKAPKAWDTSSGQGVVVAVLDTGYTDHRDLVANVVPGYDFISLYGQDANNPDVAGDGDGRDADAHDPGDWVDSTMPWCGGSSPSSWHGTHVAGTVAAVANNAQDIAGVAYGAKVQPVRVLGHCGGTTSDIADAIVWASGGHVDGVPDNANPAEVINMSLGGSGSCADDPVTQEAVDGANSRGVTVVVAAGNDNDDAAYHSPASCKGVITVGASGIDGARSYFSNYGASVTLSAPGGNATSNNDPDNRWIWSTGNTGTQAPVADSLMGYIGTSQASPHVAATVALMQAAAVAAGKPALTPVQIKQVLRSTARPFPVAPPINKQQGAGILDAAAATYAATQDVSSDNAEVLTNRVAMTGQTGAAGDTLLFKLELPAGIRSLNLRSYGGSGDVSLYVSRDSVPTSTVYQRKSAKPGNSEAVVVTNPAAGTWYVRVVGETAFANVSVMGTYQ
jgi:serine protease